MSRTWGCDNPLCGMSTGFHGGLTFGSGRLDEHGYFSEPCAVCARAWERKHPEDAPCWPFKGRPDLIDPDEEHRKHRKAVRAGEDETAWCAACKDTGCSECKGQRLDDECPKC